jgi:hypothetical protein
MFRIVCTLLIGLWATLAQAQLQYTYQVLDIQDPNDGNRRLAVRQVSNDNHLLLKAQRLDWRADGDRTLTAITCLPGTFARFVRDVRQGPDVRAINNVGTVGGYDLGAENIGWAFLQTADGTCTFFRGPGNARFTAVTALGDDGWSGGYYFDPYGSGPPARERHGFRRSPDGALTLLTHGPGASYLIPAGLNLVGDLVWTGQLDIPATCPPYSNECSAGTYAAGWCDSSNACTVLTAPDGRVLRMVGLNNARQALAYSGTTGDVNGGRGWLIDLSATPPTFAELPLPPATPGYTILGILPQGLNDNGWIVGRYMEQQLPENCQYPWACLRNTKEFLAIPTSPPMITITATPETLWPPNGKLVPVTIVGTITDAGADVDPNTATYAVFDEYKLVQPQGSFIPAANGSYAFAIQLQASRNGNDRDGRQYTITVSAQDYAGNKGSAATGVIVPHD